MARYTIEVQTEKVGRGANAEERQVLCKRIRFFPKKEVKRGKEQLTGFGVLRFLCLRVLLKNNQSGKLFKVGMSLATGKPKLCWVLPDTMEHPPVMDGTRPMKRKGVIVRDTLSPKVVVPGKRIAIDQEGLARRVGAAMADQIIGLFSNRLQEIVAEDLARKAAKASAVEVVPMRKAA